MKNLICEAFCDDLFVREIPGGFGIATSFKDLQGDQLGFYVLGPDANRLFRLIDNGYTVPLLESAGATLDAETRYEAFRNILSAHKAIFDEHRNTIVRSSIDERSIPHACIDFMAMLLRVQDLAYMTQERVESTFRQDIINEMKEVLKGRAIVRENEPVSKELVFEIPDLVLQAEGRKPVAFFVATSDKRLYQAITLQMVAMYEAKKPVPVVAMLERDGVVSQKQQSKRPITDWMQCLSTKATARMRFSALCGRC